MRKTALSFTGGKDSTLTMHLLTKPPPDADEDLKARLAQCSGCTVCLFVTFVPVGRDVDFKAHALDVIELQAEALGVTHITLGIDAPYLESYQKNIRRLKDEFDITVLATGDMMDVSNGFMARAVEGTGVELLTPLWAMDRLKVLNLVWHYEMKSLVTCVNIKKFGQTVVETQEGDAHAEECGTVQPLKAPADSQVVDPKMLLGQFLSPDILQRVLLPAKAQFGVDECGELGEYHTMTCDSVLFKRKLDLQHEVRQDKEYIFLKIISAKLA